MIILSWNARVWVAPPIKHFFAILFTFMRWLFCSFRRLKFFVDEDIKSFFHFFKGMLMFVCGSDKGKRSGLIKLLLYFSFLPRAYYPWWTNIFLLVISFFFLTLMHQHIFMIRLGYGLIYILCTLCLFLFYGF